MKRDSSNTAIIFATARPRYRVALFKERRRFQIQSRTTAMVTPGNSRIGDPVMELEPHSPDCGVRLTTVA